ncbi:MFS transporter [Tabrizicola sp. M-4]|uniref:MFS transporter n=1 Tax=Tabrizicola sp. M-4 TaxID=3055847 RepID=UPI003DA91BFD
MEAEPIKGLRDSRLALGEPQVALTFAAFGGGSMLAAFLLPRILERFADRPVMLAGAGLMLAGVAATGLAGGLPALMALWAIIGFGFALTQTPIGRILNRSARPEDRPAVFAAQFALSHAAWLVTYPLAGWAGASMDLPAAALLLAAVGALALVAVMRLWPAFDPEKVAHDHLDLPADHPVLAEHADEAHQHAVVIDAFHRQWPRRVA